MKPQVGDSVRIKDGVDITKRVGIGYIDLEGAIGTIESIAAYNYVYIRFPPEVAPYSYPIAVFIADLQVKRG
jgi:hypothetical protein